MRIAPRSVFIAAVYGALAGALAAVTFWGMNAVSDAVWSISDARWYVAAAIMAGGVLIALIRRQTEDVDLGTQLTLTSDPLHLKKRSTLFLALSAIVAVGFGGAVGPEAGLIAVVSEASAIVALLIARSEAEARLIGDTGSVAALSGLYGSPPGAAVYADENEDIRQMHSGGGENATPLPLKFLGAVAGLGGFLFVANRLMPSNTLRLPLPAYDAPFDGSDLLWALVPALLGAIIGSVFRFLQPRISVALSKMGRPGLQTLIGTAVFAALAAAFPLVRFSGHHELIHALEHGIQNTAWTALLGLGFLKALALAICLSSGWRGGAAFPLMFAGAVASLAAIAFLPGTPTTVALVAGMTAATTVGMGKPIAVLLIMLMFTGMSAPGAMFIGVLIGYGASRFFPEVVSKH